LGVVATAFLALGLGVGIGGAAFSNYFASSSAGGAYAIGATQWDDSNTKTAPERVDHALPERGAVDGKNHWKDSKRHGDARRSNDRGGKKANGGGSHPDVTRHGSDNSWTEQSSKNVEARETGVFTPVGPGSGRVLPSSHAKTASAAPSNPHATDQKQKARANIAGNGPEAGPGTHDVPQKGTKQNGTRQEARPASTTKQVTVSVTVSVRGTGSSVGVTQSKWARTTATSSDNNWTNRDDHQGREIRGAGGTHVSHTWRVDSTDRSSASSATTEQVDVYGLITVGTGGDGSGHVLRDSSASTHSSWHHSNDPARDAGRWHASRSGPDHESER
jgi:hypothetical protein